MCSFWDHTGAKSEEEEGRKPAKKLIVIPALTALPISSDAQCLLAASTQPCCPLGKFSVEVIQVNAARTTLDLGTIEPKSRMWPVLSRGSSYFVFQLGKIFKPLPKFLFAVIPNEALGAVCKT